VINIETQKRHENNGEGGGKAGQLKICLKMNMKEQVKLIVKNKKAVYGLF
jgi:hypothetical protein